MSQNENQALSILREVFPDLYGIFIHLNEGHLTPKEVGEVIHKMSIVRTSDDGFGKIVLEFATGKDKKKILRVRTIQDKMVITLPEEEI